MHYFISFLPAHPPRLTGHIPSCLLSLIFITHFFTYLQSCRIYNSHLFTYLQSTSTTVQFLPISKLLHTWFAITFHAIHDSNTAVQQHLIKHTCLIVINTCNTEDQCTPDYVYTCSLYLSYPCSLFLCSYTLIG